MNIHYKLNSNTCFVNGKKIMVNILNHFILVTFSNDILDIHVILSSIMDAIWMKMCNEKTMLSFLLPHHHLLIKCTINI
jgi:hypothetical protein